MTLYSKKDLRKKRGWTESDVQLLPTKPDFFIGPKERGYYHETTVYEIENSVDFSHGVLTKEEELALENEQKQLLKKWQEEEENLIKMFKERTKILTDKLNNGLKEELVMPVYYPKCNDINFSGSEEDSQLLIEKFARFANMLKKQNPKLYHKAINYNIIIKDISDDELLEVAKKHFGVKTYWGSSYADWEIGHLQRAAVNHIRHKLTDYEIFANRIGEGKGASVGLLLLKKRIHTMIESKYSQLSFEAKKQVYYDIKKLIHRRWLRSRGPYRDIWLIYDRETVEEVLLDQNVNEYDAVDKGLFYLMEFFEETEGYEFSQNMLQKKHFHYLTKESLNNFNINSLEDENYAQIVEIYLRKRIWFNIKEPESIRIQIR
jgi:hypothetical protein